MNEIIRHAKSSKIKYDGKVLKPLSIEGVLAAIDHARVIYDRHEREEGQENQHEPIIYTFDRSPQIRAIQTSEAIAYGIKQISIDLWLKNPTDPQSTSLDSMISFNVPDPRLDIVKFLPGHTPGDVGDHQSYIDCIDLTPNEVYNVAARFAAYMIDNAKKDHVIAVSHDVAMNIFLYLLGITDYESPPIPSLSGFSYKLVGDQFRLQTHHDERQYSVPYANLKDVSELKVKQRLKAAELG